MAHRYWRLVGENGTGVNFYVIDFRLYSDYDSAAVNLVGSGTAICGSYSSTYTPDKAFNGSTGSYWSSANVTANSWDQAKTWVGYDFGSGNDKDIVAFAVYFNNNAPISVRLEYSDDGTTWTTQSTHVLRNRNVSLYDWQTYVSVPDDSALTGHRFWRINGIAPYTTTDYAWRTNEIEFRDSSNVVLTGYKSSAYYSDS